MSASKMWAALLEPFSWRAENERKRDLEERDALASRLKAKDKEAQRSTISLATRQAAEEAKKRLIFLGEFHDHITQYIALQYIFLKTLHGTALHFW